MQISWKEDNSDWCKLWKEWKSANSSNLIIYPTPRWAISNCQLSNDFLRQNNIAAKKNHFWYSLIAFLLYIGFLSLPCFSFCTLSTCYWIALCQIKDYPRSSIWQIYPTFLFFTKRQDIFTIYIGPRWCCCSCWSWCIIRLKKMCPNVLEHCAVLWRELKCGVRQKIGMMSNINVHKIHLPGQCSFGLKVILMLLCRVGTGAYP